MMESGLGQLDLPLIVADEVVEEGQHLLLVMIVPALASVFILVLQSQGVQFCAVWQLSPLHRKEG